MAYPDERDGEVLKVEPAMLASWEGPRFEKLMDSALSGHLYAQKEPNHGGQGGAAP